jgi:beta-lactamase regulating signal transducer with metallopeptidase domain
MFSSEAIYMWAGRWLPVLLDAAVKGAVLLSLAFLAAPAMRKRSAAVRQLIWVLVLGVLLVLPVVSQALPGWRVLPSWARWETPAPPVSPSVDEPQEDPDPIAEPFELPAEIPAPPIDAHATGAPTAPETPIDIALGARAKPHVATTSEIEASQAESPPPPVRPFPWLMLTWAGGFLVCLAPLVLGRISLWRLARVSRRPDGSWDELARKAAHSLSLRSGVTLLMSYREPMPMVWGAFRPKLLLPAEAKSWSADRRWVVLLHELAHAKRRDCLAKLVAHLACAVYWFNPLCWMAFKRMQREAETACDDLVLAAGHKPSDYAQHLLEIASGLKSGMLAAYSSIAMARQSEIEGRLLGILDGKRNRYRITARGLLVAALLMIAIAVPLSIMQAATNDDKPTATKAVEEESDTQPAGSRLEFRIVPNGMGSSRLPIIPSYVGRMAQPFAPRVRKDLAVNGPGKVAYGSSGLKLRWIEMKHEIPRAGLVVPLIGKYKGKDYVLLCDGDPYVMLPAARGKGAWGLADVHAAKDAQGRQAVMVKFDESGSKLFERLTKANKGNVLAVVVDGKVLSSPAIRTTMSTHAMIVGDFTDQQVRSLVGAFKAGMPPNKLPATQPAAKGAGKAAFQTLRVAMTTTWPWNRTITIHGDGTYVFDLQQLPGKAPMERNEKHYIARYRIQAAHLRRLEELLGATKWLAAPGKVDPRLKDGLKCTLAVVRGGRTISTVCYGDQGQAYKDLVRFLRRINRQEWLLYQMTPDARYRANPIGQLDGELDAMLGKRGKTVPYAPVLDYERLLPALRFLSAEVKLHKAGQDKRIIEKIKKLVDSNARKKPATLPAAQWGKAVDGVQVRLRAKQSKWKQSTVARLWADVRNQGERNLLVRTELNSCELEVDGRWYRWLVTTWGMPMPPQPFPPGRQYDNIAVDVGRSRGSWELKASEGARRSSRDEWMLKLTAGKHTIRVAFTATAAKNAPGKPVRAVSNPVEIEIEPDDSRSGSRPRRPATEREGEIIRLTGPAVLAKLQAFDAKYESGLTVTAYSPGEKKNYRPEGSLGAGLPNRFLPAIGKNWTLTMAKGRRVLIVKSADVPVSTFRPVALTVDEAKAGRGWPGAEVEDTTFWGQNYVGKFEEYRTYTREGRQIKVMANNTHVSFYLPDDTSRDRPLMQLMWSMGRGYSKYIHELTSAVRLADGSVKCSGPGTDSPGDKDPARWELVVDPAADYMVRSAKFTEEGGKSPSYEVTTSGAKIKDERTVPEMAVWRSGDTRLMFSFRDVGQKPDSALLKATEQAMFGPYKTMTQV